MTMMTMTTIVRMTVMTISMTVNIENLDNASQLRCNLNGFDVYTWNCFVATGKSALDSTEVRLAQLRNDQLLLKVECVQKVKENIFKRVEHVEKSESMTKVRLENFHMGEIKDWIYLWKWYTVRAKVIYSESESGIQWKWKWKCYPVATQSELRLSGR